MFNMSKLKPQSHLTCSSCNFSYFNKCNHHHQGIIIYQWFLTPLFNQYHAYSMVLPKYTPSTQSSIPITISLVQTTNFCSLNCFNGLVTDPPLSNFVPLKSHLPATENKEQSFPRCQNFASFRLCLKSFHTFTFVIGLWSSSKIHNVDLTYIANCILSRTPQSLLPSCQLLTDVMSPLAVAYVPGPKLVLCFRDSLIFTYQEKEQVNLKL